MSSNLTPNVTEYPGDISLDEYVYDVSRDCPTQINIAWKPPLNVNELPNIVYEIELQKDRDSDWIKLSNRGIPIVRIYTTESRFILDSHRRDFSEGCCQWTLRIRGVCKSPEGQMEGPWSNDVTLNIMSSEHVPNKYPAM